MIYYIAIVRRNQDGCDIIEPDPLFLICDVFTHAGFLIVYSQITVLRLYVEPTAVCMIDLDVPTVCSLDMLPIFERNGKAAAFCVGPFPGTEILQSTIDIVGKIHVDSDSEKLSAG